MHKKLSIAKLDFVQVCGLSLNFYNNTLRNFYKFCDSRKTWTSPTLQWLLDQSADNAPFQITVLFRFSSVWFSVVTVLLIVYPRSLLLYPFHKKLRIWWKKSFGFCQTDNPRSSFMMYCYSTDLNVYTWVKLTYQNRQVFWIQFLT